VHVQVARLADNLERDSKRRKTDKKEKKSKSLGLLNAHVCF
jgi:hypothetical protein